MCTALDFDPTERCMKILFYNLSQKYINVLWLNPISHTNVKTGLNVKAILLCKRHIPSYELQFYCTYKNSSICQIFSKNSYSMFCVIFLNHTLCRLLFNKSHDKFFEIQTAQTQVNRAEPAVCNSLKIGGNVQYFITGHKLVLWSLWERLVLSQHFGLHSERSLNMSCSLSDLTCILPFTAQTEQKQQRDILIQWTWLLVLHFPLILEGSFERNRFFAIYQKINSFAIGY